MSWIGVRKLVVEARMSEISFVVAVGRHYYFAEIGNQYCFVVHCSHHNLADYQSAVLVVAGSCSVGAVVPCHYNWGSSDFDYSPRIVLVGSQSVAD